MPSANVDLMGKADSISGTSVANTSLGVPDVNGFYGTWAHIILTSSSVVSVPPTISIGNNSPNYDNIMPATLLATLANGQCLPIPFTAAMSYGGTETFCRVSVVATAITYVFTVRLYGVNGLA